MIKKQMRRCSSCGCLFEVCNKVEKHEYCRKKGCRQARKNKWQQTRLKNDETYRKDQKNAQADWLNNNPDYWKNYRRNNKPYTNRNREKQLVRNKSARSKISGKPVLKPIAKMDTLIPKNNIISGKYKLVPVEPDMIAKMDALIVEIRSVSGGYAGLGP